MNKYQSVMTCRSLVFFMLLATSASLYIGPAFGNDRSTDIPVWQPTAASELRFDVLRNGNRFGEHIVRFEQLEEELRVVSEIELEVKFGPIRVFHYQHESEEIWVDGALVSLVGETKKDGDIFTVSAQAGDDSLTVQGTLFSGNVPTTIIPSSHWNIAEVYSGQILSTEGGNLLAVNSESLGWENIVVGGVEIRAERFRLQSDLTVDLWYDETGRWVKCAFDARGQSVEYVLR